MIEILLPDPPTKMPKQVISWQCFAGGHGCYEGQKQKMIDSKSFTHGAYPKNVIGRKDYERQDIQS